MEGVRTFRAWVLLLVPLLVACSSPGDKTVDGIPLTEGRLALHVLDNLGQAVEGATVRVGDASIVTEGDGTARFTGLTPGSLVARVQGVGFAPATTAVEVPGGLETSATTRLLPLGIRSAFKAEDGVYLVRDRVRLELPAASLVDKDGQPVTGDVEVTVVPLDPTTKALYNAPGPFRALRADGSEVLLDSGYMAEITVWKGAEMLQLAPGKKATVGFTLPDRIQGTVEPGARVPMWWFDTEAGVWREEGEGVIEAGPTPADPKTWVAQVPHFTWWNYDRPLEFRNCVIVTVVDGSDGRLRPGITVRVAGGPSELIPWGGFEEGTTGGDGKTCIDFPRGATVILEALGPQQTLLSRRVTLEGGPDAASCKFTDGVGCFEVELELGIPCMDLSDCNVDDPCVEPLACEDGECTFQPASWIGQPCGGGACGEGVLVCRPESCNLGDVCLGGLLQACKLAGGSMFGAAAGCCEDADCDDRNPCTDDWCDAGLCRSASPASWVGTPCSWSTEFGTCQGTWGCDPRQCKGWKACTLEDARVCRPDPSADPGDSCCTELRCTIRSGKGNCDVVFNTLFGTEPGDSPRAKCQGMCAKGVKDFDREAGSSGCQVGLHGLTCASCCALGTLPVIDRPCDDDPCTDDQCDETGCRQYPLAGQACQVRNEQGACDGKTTCKANGAMAVIGCDAPTPKKGGACE